MAVFHGPRQRRSVFVRVVVDFATPADEWTDIGDQVVHLLLNPERYASCAAEGSHVSRSWNLDSWTKGYFSVVVEMVNVKRGDLNRLPRYLPIGLDYRTDDRSEIASWIRDPEATGTRLGEPQNLVLVLVGQASKVDERMIEIVILRPVLARMKWLELKDDVPELIWPEGTQILNKLPPFRSMLMLEDGKVPLGLGDTEAGHRGVPDVVQTSSELMHGIADDRAELEGWERFSHFNLKNYNSRLSVVLMEDAVRVIPLVPAPEDLLRTYQMSVCPSEAKQDWL